MQFIDLKTQYKCIEDKINQSISNVLNHGAYVMGPEVKQLETQLAEFVGVKHAIGVSSGTDALLIALMALGIKAGDEVITSPFSFFSTAEVIALLGAVPVFVDINRQTYNLDANLLQAAITPKTKVIMPVSMYGQCPDFDAINHIASQYDIPVIEDGAQSFGATYKSGRSCGMTTIGCTSFFPSKPLGAYGDGGACFTNDDDLAEHMRSIRVHGQERRYHHTRLGINGRLDTLQAAILLNKLEIFPEEIQSRQVVANRYTEGLKHVVKTPSIMLDYQSVYAQYTIEVPKRDEVQAALKLKGVPTAVHYPVSLNQQPIFKSLYNQPANTPHSDDAAKHVMSLPMHPYMAQVEQEQIIQSVLEVLQTIQSEAMV